MIRNGVAALVVIGCAVSAGCQQGPAALEGQGIQVSEPVRESDLRAYCPPVTLRDGTAFFRTYERGGEEDPDRIIYQASIAEVTRACTYGEGTATVKVAVAGKVVPGPKGRAGTITMPIRVAAVRGSQVLYSQMFMHPVTISDTSGATQFVLIDPSVVIPGGIDRGVQIFVGYDEGPQTR